MTRKGNNQLWVFAGVGSLEYTKRALVMANGRYENKEKKKEKNKRVDGYGPRVQQLCPTSTEDCECQGSTRVTGTVMTSVRVVTALVT